MPSEGLMFLAPCNTHLDLGHVSLLCKNLHQRHGFETSAEHSPARTKSVREVCKGEGSDAKLSAWKAMQVSHFAVKFLGPWID